MTKTGWDAISPGGKRRFSVAMEGEIAIVFGLEGRNNASDWAKSEKLPIKKKRLKNIRLFILNEGFKNFKSIEELSVLLLIHGLAGMALR